MPAPEKAMDPFPAGTISLSIAFRRYYEAVTPHWRELESNERNAHEAYLAGMGLDEPKTQEEWEAVHKAWQDPKVSYNAAMEAAERSFREYLASNEGPQACVRDPETGEILHLPKRPWNEGTNFVVPGFDEDHVGWHDTARGPAETLVRGKYRPVFFMVEDFESFLLRFKEAEGDCGPFVEESEFVILLSNEPPKGNAQRRAWLVLRSYAPWKSGVPDRPISYITKIVNAIIAKKDNSVSEDTVKRVLDAGERVVRSSRKVFNK